MYDNQQRIANKINQLKIPSDKTNILTYYHNFDNIHDTLLHFLQIHNINPTIQSKFLRSKEISNLAFHQQGHFQTSKFGCFILRLLYIDTPARLMHLRLCFKNKTNQIFVLYQTLAHILIENQQQYTLLEIVQLLKIIKEKHNETKRKADKKVSMAYNCRNGKKSGIAEFTIPSSNSSQKLHQVAKVQDFLKHPQSLSYAITQIQKNLSKHPDTKILIRYILLIYGSLCHFQTIQHAQQTGRQIKLNKEELPIYSRQKLIVIDAFNLTIQECECNISGRKAIRLTIEYAEWSLKQTTTNQFYRLQQEIYNEYYRQLGSQYNVLINDKIYCLDDKAILGTGAFGTTIQAQALQLINVETQKQLDKQKITLQYHLKDIAIKSFKASSKQYEKKGYKVSQKREQLIHTLFGQLRYYEFQKKAKKLFRITTQRELIGFAHLVVMQEIFHINGHSQKQQGSQKIFIVFQQARGTFLSQKIIDSLNKYRNSTKIKLHECIFKQLLQGIYCLHYDINYLYSHLLQKYVQMQDQKQIYNNPHQIINADQRCGIYHRDIKPANIVLFYQQSLDNIQNENEIKAAIIDFGMAGIINFETNKTKTNCGSKYYMAPQIKKESQGYNQKVDIWSIGVIIYEIYTSRKLFKHNQRQQQPFSLKQMLENLDNLDRIYPGEPILVEMIKGCLQVDKKLRLDIKQVLHLLYLNRLSVPPKQRQGLLNSLFSNNRIKSNVCCLKIKYNEQADQQMLLCEDLAIKKQSDIKYCFEFGLQKLLETEAINLELKVQILKATLKAVTKRHNRNEGNYSQVIGLILFARILKTQVNKQEFIIIDFTQKYAGNILKQLNKRIYQLNSSLTLKMPNTSSYPNNNCYVLIFRQRERAKLNSEQRYFQAYKITISNQQQTVTVQNTIYQQQKEDYLQQHNVDLFLTKSNLKHMVQTNGRCELLWHYPPQSNTTEETVQKITFSLTNIIKYFNQNPTNKQCKIHIRQKYYHKQQNGPRQETIERLAKIWCEHSIVTFQFDTAMLQKHTKFYSLLKTVLFNQRFKERCFDGIVQELKRTEKLQFKYAYNLYLYQQAKDYAHFQELTKQFSSFGQNPTYFINKMNMLANNIYLQCYRSKMKQVKNLFTYFMDDLQKVGNHIYRHMQHKFEMRGSRLQEQYFHNKIHYGKANLHKLYQTRQNIIQLCKIHPKQLQNIKNVLDQYKKLFLFIAVLWQNMYQIDNNERLNISELSKQLDITQLQADE